MALPPEILTKIEQDCLLPSFLADTNHDDWLTVILCGKSQGTEGRRFIEILNKPGNAQWVDEAVALLKDLGFKDTEEATPEERSHAPMIVLPDTASCTVTVSAKADDLIRALSLKHVFAATFVTNEFDERRMRAEGRKL